MPLNLTSEASAPRVAAAAVTAPRPLAVTGDAGALITPADGFAVFMRAVETLCATGRQSVLQGPPLPTTEQNGGGEPAAVRPGAHDVAQPQIVMCEPAAVLAVAAAPPAPAIIAPRAALPMPLIAPTEGTDVPPHRPDADLPQTDPPPAHPDLPDPVHDAMPPVPILPVLPVATGETHPRPRAAAKDDTSQAVPLDGPRDGRVAVQAYAVKLTRADANLVMPEAKATVVAAKPQQPQAERPAPSASAVVEQAAPMARSVPERHTGRPASEPKDRTSRLVTASAPIEPASPGTRSVAARPADRLNDLPTVRSQPSTSSAPIGPATPSAIHAAPSVAEHGPSPDQSAVAPPQPGSSPSVTDGGAPIRPVVSRPAASKAPAPDAAGIDIRFTEVHPRARPDSIPRDPIKGPVPDVQPAAPPSAPPALPAELRGTAASPAKTERLTVAPWARSPEHNLTDTIGPSAPPVGLMAAGQYADPVVPRADTQTPPAILLNDAPLSVSTSGTVLRDGVPENHRRVAPLPVTAQISHALAALPDHPVELVLAPQELGHVRLHLSAADGVATVAITAERPETLDLIRRNAEDLARDFRDLGYRDVTFTFGQDQRPSGRHRDPAAPGSPDPGDDTPASPPPARAYSVAPRKAAADGAALDIRL
jgi:flagellar hook-length control protein FliK